MADDQADIDDFLSDEPQKKESIVPLLAALGIVSVLAVGAGWFLGGQLAAGNQTAAMQDAAEKEPEKKAEKKEDKEKTDNVAAEYKKGGDPKIVRLDPIIVSLAGNSGTFLRMELAIILKDGADAQSDEDRLRIGSELAAFTQTMSIDQISGPSGFMHLREDLLDRARLSTAGAAQDVLVLSWVSE